MSSQESSPINSSSQIRKLPFICTFMLASLPSIANAPESRQESEDPVAVTRTIDDPLDQLGRATLPEPTSEPDEIAEQFPNSRIKSEQTSEEVTSSVDKEPAAELAPWGKRLREFFSSWEGKITSATILAAIGVLAAFRGLIKGSWEASVIVKGLRAFSARDFTKCTNLNVYYFHEGVDGESRLRPITKAHLPTSDLFPSLGYQKHFMKAAKKCTEEQGVVSLEFPKDSESLGARIQAIFRPVYLMMFGLGYTVSFGRWRPCEARLKIPDDRYTALNRVNKALREVVSPLYNKEKADYAQFADRLGLEVVAEQVIIIPFCDVRDPRNSSGAPSQESSEDARKSRSLILISLTKEDAKKFRKKEVVEQMKIEGDYLPDDRPLQIHQAIRERTRYKRMFRDSYEKRQELFPVVDVLFLKKKGSDKLLMPLHELTSASSSPTEELLRELIAGTKTSAAKSQQLTRKVEKLLDHLNK